MLSKLNYFLEHFILLFYATDKTLKREKIQNAPDTFDLSASEVNSIEAKTFISQNKPCVSSPPPRRDTAAKPTVCFRQHNALAEAVRRSTKNQRPSAGAICLCPAHRLSEPHGSAAFII